MAILDLKEKIEPFRKNATGYVKQLLSADHVVMSDGTTLQTKMDSLNSALTSKSNLKNENYEMNFCSIYTQYENRVEAMKDSLKNRPQLYCEGVNIVYIISPSDDRGMALVIKKNATRCAFHYFDYWGANEFWILTSVGWEKKV